MALIKLTQVATRAQISPLAIDPSPTVRDAMGGKPLPDMKLGELKESDMVAKPLYLRHDQILGVTTLNDPMPIAQAAVFTSFAGVIFVAEDATEVARLVRAYGND